MSRFSRSRMPAHTGEELREQVRRLALPLGGPESLEPLVEQLSGARYVLLGEASHGTHEYYTWRAEITRQLIRDHGFSFVAVEGDWPDCRRVDRFVRGACPPDVTAHTVLDAFDRWPTWMWANREVEDFIGWLRGHNDALPPERRVGFFGVDVYSLWDSIREVQQYLERVDPEAARAARWAYGCFDPYLEDAEEYALATRGARLSCEEEVVAMLAHLRCHAPRYEVLDGASLFDAEQNALVAKNAELYYRTMVRGGAESWNVRDRHMVETLERLMRRHGPSARAVVWEHNTHIGDARFTDMAEAGMVNVGQLVRERHEAEGVAIVGFGGYRGSVIAGDSWGAPMRRVDVPPAREGSWEALLHESAGRDSLLLLDGETADAGLLEPRGHRAIGVVYQPRFEAYGNYVPTVLPRRYDAFLYFEETEALRPLHLHVRDGHEVPETYPSGV